MSGATRTGASGALESGGPPIRGAGAAADEEAPLRLFDELRGDPEALPVLAQAVLLPSKALLGADCYVYGFRHRVRRCFERRGIFLGRR